MNTIDDVATVRPHCGCAWRRSFGVRTNQFGFNINWAGGMDVAVDVCTDLANPVWTPLQTNTLTANTLYFGDPRWTSHRSCFYRLRWP